MSASDHLSRQQFPSMPIDQIMGLRSMDAHWKGDTVADVLPTKEREVAADPHGEFGKVRESMRTHGQTYPVCIDEGCLQNGHHRLVIARQLGWTHMQHTNDFEKSGGEFEDIKLDDIQGGRR